MVSRNEQVESFFNSLNAVKDVFSPVESGFMKVARDLELCWLSQKNGVKYLENFPQFNVIVVETDGNKVVESGSSSVKKKKQFGDVFMVDGRKKGSSTRVTNKTFLANLFQNNGSSNKSKTTSDLSNKGSSKEMEKEDGSCVNCLQFAMTWSVLVNSFVQAIPTPFKPGKKRFQKQSGKENASQDSCKQPSLVSPFKRKQKKSDAQFDSVFQEKGGDNTRIYKGGEILSLELLVGFLCDQIIQNISKFDEGIQRSCNKSNDKSNMIDDSSNSVEIDHLGLLKSMFKGRKADVNSFLGNLSFARVGGVPSSMVGVPSVKEEDEDIEANANKEEPESNTPQKIATGLLNIPLSNVERLRSTLSTVSLSELIELVPQIGRPSKDEHPDKKKLFSVQDFFRYTESEGKRFFEELDRDGDGQVTLEDLEIEMKKRRLPRKYARDFMRRTRNHFFSKSVGWKQFLSFMEQKEPTILRAYTTLCLSKSGTLQKGQILTSLKNAGLPANEDNAVAMMRFLNADTGGSISYGHFRNFMLLLPSDRLTDDPRSIWFEAATVVAVPPPVEIPAGSVLKAALAGGLACALSTSLLHPVDTIKTRVQASTLSFPQIIAKLPQIGVQGLYRGSIPAILGQFSSHGLRTGIFEASKLVLINFAPTLAELQVQSIASFCSTILGTAVRIPCEVLKQRCQAGIFDNVGEALVGTLRQDGIKGFFRGTGATLCREVPFYVAGMGLYAESKKGVQQFLRRELEPWETILVGALSGGLAAVVTTPFDVLKTRTMTAPQGLPVSMSMIAFSILRQEGPLGLFKGALPRFFWIAPLGAMNFAGYELARKAMDKKNEEQLANDQLPEKKLANAG
ncbi:hypothetical protein MKW98_026860 [Papaver atlanticum]|uniref:EF-hand domain-containing protein n=1 Tax=Papaver atlanticum TaxID=357466 RepID=A0AAD4X5S6_9MAGN|nr:hypothetical protein MKW98_026860 [Papaver atlanticum]